jgi:hypothetical protein
MDALIEAIVGGADESVTAGREKNWDVTFAARDPTERA